MWLSVLHWPDTQVRYFFEVYISFGKIQNKRKENKRFLSATTFSIYEQIEGLKNENHQVLSSGIIFSPSLKNFHDPDSTVLRARKTCLRLGHCEKHCRHRYFVCRRKQNSATPPRLFFFFLKKKYVSGYASTKTKKKQNIFF